MNFLGLFGAFYSDYLSFEWDIWIFLSSNWLLKFKYPDIMDGRAYL